MNQFKIFLIMFLGGGYLIFGAYASAGNEITPVKGSFSEATRYKEDIVDNPQMFMVDIPGENKAGMSAKFMPNNKIREIITPRVASEWLLQNDYDMVGKYKKSLPGTGMKK